MNKKARIFGTAAGRQSLIGTRDSAAYVVATLKEPIKPTGRQREFRISGESPSYAELFQILGRITGGEYDVTYLHVEDALVEEKQAKESGDVEAELAASQAGAG